MITCKFTGGLGNNIYQLAFLYNLHKKYNVDYIIPSSLDRGKANFFKQSDKLEFKRLFENKFNYSDNIDYSKYKRYIHIDLCSDKFHYTDIPFSDNVSYEGYFQSDKYFSDFNIKEEFILNTKIKEELLEKYSDLFSKKTISLHYRLAGDRVENSVQHYHKDVSINFYKEAINLIVGDNNINDYNILLFSDNIDKASLLLKNSGIDIIQIRNIDNVEDFILMSVCDYNIIGNSTFAWWAAYLNQKNSKVIAPKTEWFGPGYKHFILDDLFPKKWTTL
jgi:hypothetical protein